MKGLPMAQPAHSTEENFADLLEESLKNSTGFDGRVVRGRVIAIEGDFAIIDVGLKAEGRVAAQRICPARQAA